MRMTLQCHAKRQGVADWQCSGILTKDFWSSFYIFWTVVFIWFYFSWLLSAMSAQVLSWALMVVCIWIKFTLDPSGHLSVHWSLGCTGLDGCTISNLYGGGGVGICETTRYCFSSFEFGTPQTFVKGIPVNPSCCITLPSMLSRVLRRVSREAVHVHHAWMEKRKMAARPAGVHECSEQQSLQGSYLGPSFRETSTLSSPPHQEYAQIWL